MKDYFGDAEIDLDGRRPIYEKRDGDQISDNKEGKDCHHGDRVSRKLSNQRQRKCNSTRKSNL